MYYKVQLNIQGESADIGEQLANYKWAIKLSDAILDEVENGKVLIYRKKSWRDNYKWWMTCTHYKS